MLKKLVIASVLVASTLGTAYARSTEMFQPERTTPVATDGKAPSKQKMHDAIVAAAKSRNWVVAADKPGTITLHYARSKLDVVIDVNYDDKSYQIKYVSSENLNFSVNENGKPSIHPKYNEWVTNLGFSIAHEY